MATIQSKTQRAALRPRREPYWSRISAGLFVGFRRLDVGEGTWIARRRGEDGKQQYHSLGTQPDYDTARKEAEAWARDRDQGINVHDTTVGGACRSYVDHLRAVKGKAAATDAEWRFRQLVYGKPFERIPLNKLQAGRTWEWLEKQVPDDDDPELVRKAKDSANRSLNTLKAALNKALRDGKVATDTGWKTVTRFKDVGKRRERLLDKKERAGILNHLPEDAADLCRAILLTFARPGEIAKADVKDFDPRAGTLALNGKTGPRITTLSTAAIQFFKKLTRGKLPRTPLLPRADGGRWNKDAWKYPIRESVKAAELPAEIVMYHLRHAAISEAIMAGMDSFMVAKQAGTSVEMIERHYGHLRHENTRACLDAIKVL